MATITKVGRTTYAHIDADSLSNLPSCDAIRSFSGTARPIANYYQVRLPVYVLGLLKKTEWRRDGYGFMVVTDFTSNLSSGFARGMAGASLPKRYTIGAKPVTPDKLFSISVNYKRIENLKAHLIGLIPSDRRRSYDFADSDKCSIGNEGIFIDLTFLLKEYNNSIEGVYSSHEELSPAHVSRLYRDQMSKIINISVRFSHYCDDFIFAKLKHQYFQFWVYREQHARDKPTETINSSSQGNSSGLQVETTIRSSQIRSHEDDSSMEAKDAKKRKLTGTEILFQQQDIQDSQAPIFTQTDNNLRLPSIYSSNILPSSQTVILSLEQDECRLLDRQGQYSTNGHTQDLGTTVNMHTVDLNSTANGHLDLGPCANDTLHYTLQSLALGSAQHSRQPDFGTQRSQYLTQVGWDAISQPKDKPLGMSLSRLKKIPYSQKSNKIHDIEAQCQFVPDINMVVKPYKRTIKVSNFKLLLTASNDELVLEFNDEKDFCRFFKVEEIEEIHDKIPEITAALKQLQDSVDGVTLQVQRRVVRFNKFIRPYWTCMTDIDQLIAQVTSK